MADVAQLSATLGLNPAPFIAGLKKSETAAALFSTSSQTALLGLGAVAVGVGAGLFAIGQMYEKADNHIAAATGATGQELEALGQNMRNVFTKTPADLNAVGDAIVGVQQKLNLAGKPLEEMALQFLRLSRITKTDLDTNIDSVAQAFRNWGVAAEDMPATLDALYVASQQTGVGVSDLASQLQQGGAAFRALGIPMEEAAAMVANLSEEGVSSSRVIAGLNRAAIGFANGSAQATTGARNLAEMVEGVKNGTIGLNEVTEVFGARGAVTFYDAMRTGAIGGEALAATMAEAEGSIAEASSQVSTLSGKLTVLLHRAIANIEPVATAMLNALTSGLQSAIEAFDAIPGPVKRAMAVILGLAAAMAVLKAAFVAYSAATALMAIGIGKVITFAKQLWTTMLILSDAVVASPWGALAFAVGAAVAAFGIFRGSAEETTGDVDALSEALREQNGLLGTNAEAWLRNTLTGSDAAEGSAELVAAMERAGLSITDLNRAVAGGEAGRIRFLQQIAAANDLNYGENMDDDMLDLAFTVSNLGDTFGAARADQEAYNQLTNEGADAVEAQAQAMNDLVTEIQQYIAITQGVRQAQVAQQESQKSLYDSLLEAPKNFNAATVAGRQNINMSDAYVASIASTVEALARQANSSQATGREQVMMNRTIQGGVAQLRAARDAGLLTQSQYRRLAGEMRGIPHDVPANVTSNVENVLTLFERLPQAIRDAATAADAAMANRAAALADLDAFPMPGDEAFSLESMMVASSPTPITGRGAAPTAEAIGRAVANELQKQPMMTVDVGR